MIPAWTYGEAKTLRYLSGHGSAAVSVSLKFKILLTHLKIESVVYYVYCYDNIKIS